MSKKSKNPVRTEDLEVTYLPPIYDSNRVHEGVVEIINWISKREQQNADKPQA